MTFQGLNLISSDILASGSSDQTIKLWNITNGQLIRTLTGHAGDIERALDLMSDGQTLVSGSEDHKIKLWNWKTGECLNTINTGLNIRALATIKSKLAFFLLFTSTHQIIMMLGFYYFIIE